MADGCRHTVAERAFLQNQDQFLGYRFHIIFPIDQRQHIQAGAKHQLIFISSVADDHPMLASGVDGNLITSCTEPIVIQRNKGDVCAIDIFGR